MTDCKHSSSECILLRGKRVSWRGRESFMEEKRVFLSKIALGGKI
jgi:hypothetical protein